MNNEHWIDDNLNFSEADILHYDIKVTNPRHIPGIVNRLTEMAKEEPVIAGLDHREGFNGRHAMIGVNEEIGNTGLVPGFNLFRRPDSGNTVYTSDSKYCQIIGGPIEDSMQKRANDFTDFVHRNMIDEIESYTDHTYNVYPSGRDLEVNGNQLVGMAASFNNGAVLGRSYWSEAIPEVYDLMRLDGTSEKQVERHQEQMHTSKEVLEGFYTHQHRLENTENLTSDHFLQKYGEPEDFNLYSKLLEDPDYGMERDICFL